MEPRLPAHPSRRGGRRTASLVVALTLVLALCSAGSRPAAGSGPATAPPPPTCQDSWTGLGGTSDWATAGNWSVGIPGPTSAACITMSGTFGVVLTIGTPTAVTVGSLQVGSSAATGTQSLELRSLSCATPGLVVTTTNGTWVGATGHLTLDWVQNGGCSGGESSTLVIGGGAFLSNAGTVTLAASSTHLQGNVINTGTVNAAGGAFSGNAEYDLAGTTFDNQGTVTIGSTALLHVANGATFFNDTSGASVSTTGTEPANDLAQVLLVDEGSTFHEGAGTTTGNPVTVNGGTAQFTGSGAAHVVLQEAIDTTQPSLSGDIAAGQVVTIESFSCLGPGTQVAAAGSFANAGSLNLTWITTGACSPGESATLTLPGGATLTNSGTITLAASTARLRGNVVNTGTVNAAGGVFDGNAQFDLAGTTFDNQGAVTIGTTALLHIANGATFFNDTGGSVTTAGVEPITDLAQVLLVDEGSTYRQGGGTTAGNPVTVNGGAVQVTGSGAAQMILQEASDTTQPSISGNLAAGQNVFVHSFSCLGPGTQVSAAGSFSNAGTVTLNWVVTGGCAGGESATLTLPGGATLTNSGTITLASDNARLRGNVVNTGTVQAAGGAFSGNAEYDLAGTTFDNQGTVSIGTPAYLHVANGATFFNDNGGTVTAMAAPAPAHGQNEDLWVDVGSTYHQGGGTTTGNPVAVSGGVLQYTGSGASSVLAEEASDTTQVTMTGNVAAGQQLTLHSLSCLGPGTQVSVPGDFTNAGIITLTWIANGGCAGGESATLAFPASSTLTNSGTLVLGANNASIQASVVNTGKIFAQGGAFSGIGTIHGDVTNNGTIEANSNGGVQITGNLTDGATADLNVNIVGNATGNTMVQVLGSAAVAGSLNFTTTQGFSPTVGDVHHLLSGGSMSGALTGATGLSAGGSLGYQVVTGATTINAKVVSMSTFPFVASVDPPSGPAGTTVTVAGPAVGTATAVDIGATPATGVLVVAPDRVTAVVPAGSGTQPVTVVTPGGTSQSLGAPSFTYAATVPPNAPPASLTLRLVDSTGTALPGITFAITDSLTHNPVGILTTGADGTGSIASGLKAGQTVEAGFVSGFSPYGPAGGVFTLAAGSNNETIVLPIQPLVTSNPSSSTPAGGALATWPTVVPTPNTPTPNGGAPLAATTTLAHVQFTLAYTAGARLLLSGSADGTQPVCTDGTWTLTLRLGVTDPSPKVLTGACPGGSATDVATLLSLAPGTYGGDLTVIAPAGATHDGTGDVFLLPAPGAVTNLIPVPGGITAAAVLSGSTTVAVGQSGAVSAVLGGLPLPAATFYTASFGFDPGGISVTQLAFPAAWFGQTISTRTLLTGTGAFTESNFTNPIAVGGTVVTVDVACHQIGIWPVTFVGNYATSASSGGSTSPVSGSVTVTCSAPPPAPGANPQGVSIDPATGDVTATLTGQSLGAATSAKLLNTGGAVVATSTSVTAGATVVTATFPPTPPGQLDMTVLDGAQHVVATTTGAPYQLEPALPLFEVQAVPHTPERAGVTTTPHFYRLTNDGTLDGTAVYTFSFPSFLSPEPTIDLAGAPPGTRLLLHGLTADSWVEYVAVPLGAGASTDLGWSYVIPPSAVPGSIHSGQKITIVPGLAGQYTAPEWATVSSGTSQAVVDGAMAAGMNDDTAAYSDIAAMPRARLLTYLQTLPNVSLAQAMAYIGTEILQSLSAGDLNSAGFQPTVAPPNPSALLVFGPTQGILAARTSNPSPAAGVNNGTTPPAAGGAQPADGLGDPTATAFANFDYNTGEALDSQYGVENPLPVTAGDTGIHSVELAGGGGTTPTAAITVGARTTYQGGSIAPVMVGPTGGQASGLSGAMLPDWQPTSVGVNDSSWLSGVTSAFQVGGTTGEGAALPELQTGNGQTMITGTVVISGSLAAQARGPHIVPDFAKGDPTRPVSLGTALNTVSPLLPSVTSTILGIAADAGILYLTLGPLGIIPFVIALVVITCLQICPALYQVGQMVVSHDPNDIVVTPTGTGGSGFVTPQPLTYTIDFQNDPKATGSAENVVVELPLDPNLDPATIVDGPSSYGPTQFAYDPASDSLRWTLPGINLPPDTSPPNGEGSVSFTATPRAGLPNGSTITEAASVLFDFNAPVVTTPVTTTLDTAPPTVAIAPLAPSQAVGPVTMSWSSPSPVGIASYHVYVSTDGGPLQAIGSTAQNQLLIHAQPATTYGIAVQATDAAGLTGPAPVVPQATFSVPPDAYRLVASDGGVFAFGRSQFFGSTGSIHLNQPIVGMATTSSGHGYWMVASDGGIFAFGDAGFFGSTGSIHLNRPIVGMAATPTGLGYWLVASDGGIFAFGDAGFFGSTGSIHLNQPIVAMAATPTGLGYWLVASDGGIFAFGDAGFFGSTGSIHLNRPMVGMAVTPTGQGYWLVASDGGIFAFGDAAFFGSTGSIHLNRPIVGMASTPSGLGYWLVASDGGIFAYGDAGFFGSTGSIPLNQPIVGMAPTPVPAALPAIRSGPR